MFHHCVLHLERSLGALLREPQGRGRPWSHSDGVHPAEVHGDFQQETAEGLLESLHGILGTGCNPRTLNGPLRSFNLLQPGLKQSVTRRSQDIARFVYVVYFPFDLLRVRFLLQMSHALLQDHPPTNNQHGLKGFHGPFSRSNRGSKCSKVGSPKMRGCRVRMGKG